MSEYKLVSLQNLCLDLTNPRFLSSAKNQKDAITAMLQAEDDRIVNLAKHIASNGPNPSSVIMVISEPDGLYTVVDGNRRVTAMKLLDNPHLAEFQYYDKFRQLSEIFTARKDYDQVFCVAFASRAESRAWIELNHLGLGDGAGTHSWGTEEKQRFSKKLTPATIIVDHFRESGLIPKETRLALTTLDRLLNSKDIRKLLGFDIDENHRIVFLSEKKAVSDALFDIVNDLIEKRQDSRSWHSQEDRQAYANEIAKRHFGASTNKQGSESDSEDAGNAHNAGDPGTSEPDTSSKNTKNRLYVWLYLVPGYLKSSLIRECLGIVDKII